MHTFCPSCCKHTDNEMGNIIVEKNDILDRLLMSGEMEAKVRAIIRRVLKSTQKALSEDVRGALPHDPRDAYKAVRHSVYKRVLGGSVSILNRRKRSGQTVSVRMSRRGRSARTEQVMSYAGEDRGFILRFINSGTGERTVTTMNAHEMRRGSVEERPGGKRNYKGGLGNRGSVRARNFFGRLAQKEMNEAAQKIGDLIEAEFNKMINKG